MRKLRITIENRSYEVTVEDITEGGQYPAASGSVLPQPTVPAPAAAPAAAAAQPSPAAPAVPGAVISPMAGAIKAIKVEVGASVTQGQALMVLEAMKMENQITAPHAGTVKRIDVKEGDSVLESQVLLVLE